jgi:hypothetical protein
MADIQQKEAERLLDESDEEDVAVPVHPAPVRPAPMEVEEPSASAPTKSKWPQVKVQCYNSKSVNFLAAQAKGDDGCRLCGYVGEKKELALHVRQHFTRWFCVCGTSTSTRALLLDHVYRLRRAGSVIHITQQVCFETDENNFSRLIQEQSLPESTVFGRLWPTLPASSASVVEPKTETKTKPSLFACTDVRLLTSKSAIEKDAGKIRKEREQHRRQEGSSKGRNGKRPRSSSGRPAASTDGQEVESEVREERDRLRQENVELRMRCDRTERALVRVKGHLVGLQEAMRHVPLAQAILDCQFD